MDVTIMPAPCLPASSMSNRLIMALLSLSRWLMGSSRKIKSNGWQRLRIKSDALLLPEGKLAGSFVGFVGNAGCFEKGENFFFLLMVGQAVL